MSATAPQTDDETVAPRAEERGARRILGLSDSPSIFVAEWETPHYMRLLRKLTEVDTPRITYIGAAKGDRPERQLEFINLCRRTGCIPHILNVYAMQTDNPDTYFADTHAVLIDGGVTRNLIALLKAWQMIDPLIEAYRGGMVIAGASAGISMLAQWCITDSIRTEIRPMRGLGVLKGTVCAHHDRRVERRTVLRRFLNSAEAAFPAYALEDGTAVLFENERLKSVLTVQPDAKVRIGDQGPGENGSLFRSIDPEIAPQEDRGHQDPMTKLSR